MDFKLLSSRLSWAKAQKEERDGCKYRWADFARISGASPVAVSNWKADVNGITSRYARPLGEWLGVSALWLETGEGDPTSAQTANHGPGTEVPTPSFVSHPNPPERCAPTRLSWISDDEEHLLTMFRTTDDRGRETIMATAEVTPKLQFPGIARHKS